MPTTDPATLARDRAAWSLALANDAWGRALSRPYRDRSALDADDLASEARLGLYRAALDHDPAVATFTTYSTRWVRQRVGWAVRAARGPLRVPHHAHDLLARRRRGDRLGAAHRELAASAAVALTGGTVPAAAAATLPAGADPAALAERADLLAMIRARVAALPADERAVLTLRYLAGSELMLLAEIARRLGRSEGWAKAVERRALARLREAFHR